MSDVEIWSPDPEAIVAAAPIEWTPDPSWFHEVPEWLDATWEDGVVQLGPDDEVTRVAALVAPYGECILDGGRNGQACFTPPISPTNYEYAHVGALRTADGSIARVANIGGGVPHYDPNKPLDMSPAVHHYANTASRVMVGRYYDRPDLGGIIFLGATWPGVDPQVARSAPLSGDWRWVDSMQEWDFAGAQQVLNPGFRPNRHNRRRASTVGRHSLLAPALSNMEFAMVASLGPSGDEHMLGAWVPSDDGNVLAPATLIDLAELSAIVASLEDELAVLIEDSTPLLPFYDQPTEAIVASARKRRKKRSDAWLATHPNKKSTPLDIAGKHGHRPHGPSILSPRIYEHLRAKGYSKSKAAAISNAMFNKRRGKPPKSVKGTKGLVGVGKVASLGTPVDLGDATIDGEPMTKGNIILVPDNPDTLTVPGGDPADVLHATLKFLGDLDPWDDEQRERAEGIVGEWARTHGPFTATVAGVGELGDDGAVVYHFDGDDLQAARADLSAAIDDGTAPDTTDTYPSFKPHVTAGYGIDAPPVPTEPITFSRARVQWADEALEWPLGQPVEAPVAAARPRKRLRQAESLFDGPNAGRVGGGRHDYHDPNTGEFAPLGYVSPQVLRKLLSDNPTLRREAELAIRTKFDSPKAQPWVRAFQNATPTKRGKIARNARREIIGDRPDGTTADDRKAQVAWDRASDVVARGLARGTGGEDRMVDVPDALDDGRPRPVGITPSGAQVFRDEDFTRLRPHELRPGDLIGNAERDDGLETVEVTAVRTDGGRTLVDVGTSEVPYARDDIVKVLRRPDELTAAEARKPKPVNPDQGGLFDAPDDDPIPAPEPELSGPEADAAAMGALGRIVFERVAQGEVLRKADEAFDKDSLDKLVGLGVIEPAPRPDKRKAQQYVLTPKGTDALPIIQQATRDRERRRREKWEAKNGITPTPAPVVPVAPRPEPEPPQVVNATPYHVEAIRRWAEGTIDENASGARFEATSRIADVNGDKVRVDVNVRRRDGNSDGARFSLVIDTTDRSLSSGGNVSGGEQLDREAASVIKRSALKDDFVIRKVVLDDTDPRFPGVRDGWTPDEAPGEPGSIPPMSNTTDEQAAALDAAVLDVLGTSGTWFDHAQLLNRTPQGTGMDDVRKSIARLDEQGLLEYKGGFGGQVRRKPEPEVPGPPRTATQQRLDALFERAASGPSNYGPSGEPWARAIGIVNDHHVQVNIFGWGNDERRTVWVDKSDEDLTPEMAASLIGGPEAPTVDPDHIPAVVDLSYSGTWRKADDGWGAYMGPDGIGEQYQPGDKVTLRNRKGESKEVTLAEHQGEGLWSIESTRKPEKEKPVAKPLADADRAPGDWGDSVTFTEQRTTRREGAKYGTKNVQQSTTHTIELPDGRQLNVYVDTSSKNKDRKRDPEGTPAIFGKLNSANASWALYGADGEQLDSSANHDGDFYGDDFPLAEVFREDAKRWALGQVLGDGADLDPPDDDEIAEIEAELGFDAGPDETPPIDGDTTVATESRGARPGAGQGGLFDDPDLFGDEPDTPGDATPETDGSLESLSDTDLATVKAAAIEWVNVTPEPDAMRQLADVLDEEARRAELAGDTDRAAKLRANAAKWRKNAGDADEPDPEPEVDPEVERRAGYETIVADTTTIIDANRTAAEREGADPFAVNFLADTLDRRANAYDELDRTDDAAADRAHAGRLRGALAERQAREEAARNVPTLEAILGSSTFDSGRTLELGRLVNGNPDAVLGDAASRVSLGAITTAIRTLDGDLDPVEPGDRFSADSTTAAVGLALLRGARVSTIPNGIAIELSDGQAGTGGSGRYLLIRDSAGGQKLEAYDADGRRTFSGERLPFAHFTGILQPRPTGNMPDGARNAIDSARADVANPDVNTLDVLAGHRDAFVASLSTVAPPEEWHQHPGIVAAVTEFGDVLRDAVAETEAGIDFDMSAGLTEDVAAASKSFDLADALVEFADRLASDGGGFDPQDLDGHATIAEFLKATDGEFVSFADSGKLSDGSTRQSIRFAYTHESGERRTMDVDISGADWNPDDPTMSVSVYRRGGGGYRSRDVRLRGDDVRKADLKQLRSHVRATRALNRDRKRSAALGKADEVNASGTTQRRNAQAAAAVLASLGVERGLDDATADTIQVGGGTGVITRRKTVNREGLATALGRSRTVKATPAKKRGAASDADLLTVGMAQYPTSWIESLGDHTFLIARRGDADSGYNVDMSRWTSAGAPNGSYLSIPGKGDVGANVIVHEVGHTMEHKVPGLREFVLAHLDTLHAGSDPAKALPGYRSTRGYEDDIKRVYTRRVYVGNGGDPHGTWASVRSKITSTEYLTTGMETLVPEGGSTEDDFYGIDPVHDAFILGVVATFDPNAVPAAGTVVAP